MKRLAHRRRNGLESVSALTPDRLGLSRARSTQLLLESSWDEVAGETLARRARPLRLSRGVLEVEVLDERWVEPLLALIPRIAGRLNARRPQLAIRKLKIRAGKQVVDDVPQVAVPGDAAPPAPPESREVGRAPAMTIEQVRDLYLERRRSR